MNAAQGMNPLSPGLGPLGAASKPIQQLTIVRVENGFVLNPSYNIGENKVALGLNDMLDLVKEYYSDKPAAE